MQHTQGPLPVSTRLRLIGLEKWAVTQHLLLKGPISSLIAIQNQISGFKFTLCPRGTMKGGRRRCTLHRYVIKRANSCFEGKIAATSVLAGPLLWCLWGPADGGAHPGFRISLWDDGDAHPGFRAAPASPSSHIIRLTGGCCDHQEPLALLSGLCVPPTPTKDGRDAGALSGSQVMAAAHLGLGMALAALLML